MYNLPMLKITHSKAKMTLKRRNAVFAAQFHACKLGLAEMSETIHIVFDKGFKKRTQTYADCGPENGKIVLTIDADLDYQIMQSTIAHEMVHAKQWLTGELSVTKSGLLKWKGKKVSSKLAYHRTPWELEAMSNEVIMLHDFSDFITKV